MGLTVHTTPMLEQDKSFGIGHERIQHLKKLLTKQHYPHDRVMFVERKPNASCESRNPYTRVATLCYTQTMELETRTSEPSRPQ